MRRRDRTYEIDAAVQPPQSPVSQSPMNPIPGHAEPKQLLTRDDAVLPRGKLRGCPLESFSHFDAHSANNSAKLGCAPVEN